MEEWGDIIGSFLGGGLSKLADKKKKKEGEEGTASPMEMGGGHELWESKPVVPVVGNEKFNIGGMSWRDFTRQVANDTRF
jgi:hypothetical protein